MAKSTTLMHASHEWATRRDDEKYSSLESLHTAALRDREMATEQKARLGDFQVVATGDQGLMLEGRSGERVEFTNWSFGQLCSMVGAPASYLSTLPNQLAQNCLNNGLKPFADVSNDISVMLRTNVGESRRTLRTVNSDSYARFWNHEIVEGLMDVQSRFGFQPAPAAFDDSRGLYLGDRDMFCFMVDNDRRIFETLPGGGLSRGFFLANSEVGARSFWLMTFLYEYVCGNHRVWGAQVLNEVRVRHVGEDNLAKAMKTVYAKLPEYLASSPMNEIERVSTLRNTSLGKDKDSVIDEVFALRVNGLSKRNITKAYDIAVAEESKYGNPRSVWGFTGGLTQLARDMKTADSRAAVEQQARKVMETYF